MLTAKCCEEDSFCSDDEDEVRTADTGRAVGLGGGDGTGGALLAWTHQSVSLEAQKSKYQ